MPTSPLLPCAVPGCRGRVSKGKCDQRDAHPGTAYVSRRSPDDAFYQSSDWLAMRRRVLSEEHNCRRCGRALAGRNPHVDHIVPISEGGAKLDRSNLQALCGPRCHMAKTSRDKKRRSQEA